VEVNTPARRLPAPPWWPVALALTAATGAWPEPTGRMIHDPAIL
jgi:hypothetical protein